MSSNKRDTASRKPVPKPTSAITPIQNYMMSTFVRLRVWVGIVGLVFPFVLWGGGHLYQIPLAPSMSAYYHATADCYDPKHNERCPTGDLVKGGGPMRNTFVGLLFVIGAVMLFMKGFSYWEDVALDIAGVAAALVAPEPHAVGEGKERRLSNPQCLGGYILLVSSLRILVLFQQDIEILPGHA